MVNACLIAIVFKWWWWPLKSGGGCWHVMVVMGVIALSLASWHGCPAIVVVVESWWHLPCMAHCCHLCHAGNARWWWLYAGGGNPSSGGCGAINTHWCWPSIECWTWWPSSAGAGGGHMSSSGHGHGHWCMLVVMAIHQLVGSHGCGCQCMQVVAIHQVLVLVVAVEWWWWWWLLMHDHVVGFSLSSMQVIWWLGSYHMQVVMWADGWVIWLDVIGWPLDVGVLRCTGHGRYGCWAQVGGEGGDWGRWCRGVETMLQPAKGGVEATLEPAKVSGCTIKMWTSNSPSLILAVVSAEDPTWLLDAGGSWRQMVSRMPNWDMNTELTGQVGIDLCSCLIIDVTRVTSIEASSTLSEMLILQGGTRGLTG